MKPIRFTRYTTLDEVEDPDFYLVDPSKVLAIYRTTNGQSTVIEMWRGQSFHVIEPTAVVMGRIEAALADKESLKATVRLTGFVTNVDTGKPPYIELDPDQVVAVFGSVGNSSTVDTMYGDRFHVAESDTEVARLVAAAKEAAKCQ